MLSAKINQLQGLYLCTYNAIGTSSDLGYAHRADVITTDCN
ncbi:hypothetical protein HMPREF0476_0628 [Kingella kingae ATCC 23330]|uniref:Uncharacterized protein n=1 Tax=Kingella kingae ATCC 23330 TaxID=887327 RepID=F5S5Z5_KINKI|nr:hypothetical protein HMPREF0476_0628 [Kingella kingae ATCC 23330]